MLSALKIVLPSLLLLVQAEAIVCGSHWVFVDFLEHRFGEVLRGSGFAAEGDLAEIFVSPDGSWTWTITTPEGVSCLVAVGKGWEFVPIPKEEPHG